MVASPVLRGAAEIAKFVRWSKRSLMRELARPDSRLAAWIHRDDKGHLYALEHELKMWVETMPNASRSADRVR